MDIIELLNELAGLQASDLQKKTRDELRAILRKLLQENTGHVSKLRKAELITAILDLVAEYKETQAKAEAFDRIVPELSDAELENLDQYVTKVELEEGTGVAKMAGDVYLSFRTECQKLYNREMGVWGAYSVGLSDLANQTASRLEALWKRISENPSPTTLLNYRTVLLNELQRNLELEKDQHYFNQMWRYLTGHDYSDRNRKARGKGSDCMDCFAKSLFTIWQFTYAAEKKAIEKEGIDKKETSTKQIDISALLKWANEVLEELELTSPDRKQWRPVSVALALVTGRRQVEIHSTGTFTYVDEYHVRFEGQAKARLKAWEAYQCDPSYTIPTLVKAELVIKGHTWLRTMSGKHYAAGNEYKGRSLTAEQAIRLVNDNVNRDSNAFLKTVAKGLVVGYDAEGVEIPIEELGGTFTYHDLREVYARASYECEGCKEVKRDTAYRWVAKVLGEAKGDSGALSTAMRYMDEYTLTENSLTRI